MKLREICKLLEADPIVLCDPACLDKEFTFVAATDLMSDALALVKSDSNHTMFVTGLVHAQSIRTAEMLDINILMYVRGKVLNPTDIELAEEMGMNVFSTRYSMYDTCGILYTHGLTTATR